MEVYIVARYKDNNSKKSRFTGYILMDIDNNNQIKRVHREVLYQAMKANRIKIHNARICYNAIAGTYYPLDVLPVCMPDSIDFNKGKSKLVLKEIVSNGISKYLTIRIPYNSIMDMTYLTEQSLKLHVNEICNIDSNSNLECKRVEVEQSQKEKTDEDSKIARIKEFLDNDVLNMDTVWNMQQFNDYMKLNDNYFEIQGNLLYLSQSFSKGRIKIPDGISDVIFLSNSKQTKFDSLIFPPSVNKISYVYEGKSSQVIMLNNTNNTPNQNTDEDAEVTIRQLCFQGRDSLDRNVYADYLRLGGEFDHINITGELRIDRSIASAFNYSRINKFRSTGRELYKCFNNTEFANTSLDLSEDKVVDYTECFQNCNLTSVKLGKEVRKIRRSFNKCNISKIDLDECVNLSGMHECFNKSKGIKIVDLSKLESLRAFYNSFGMSSDVEEIKFNDKVMEVGFGEYTYEDYRPLNIKKLNLPKDIKQVSIDHLDKVEEVNYPDGISTLTRGLYTRSKYNTNARLNFKAPIKFIDAYFSKDYKYEFNTDDLNFDRSQAILNKSCFAESSVVTFDSKDFPNTSTIPDFCFQNCNNIKNIILRDNIKKIGNNILDGSASIQNIVFSAGVMEFSTSMFDKMKTNLINLYVIRGTYAAKKLARSRYNVIVVDSFDEAYEKIFSTLTSESKFAKYKILLKDSKYESLLDNKYIGNISFVYPYLKALDDRSEIGSKLKLNTSKFMVMDLDSELNTAYRESELGDVLCDMASFRNNNNGEENTSMKEEMSDLFIGMCNFITTVSNLEKDLYNVDIIRKLEKICVMHNICYNDRYAITSIKGSFGEKIDDTYLAPLYLRILVISDGNKILYMTLFDDERLQMMHEKSSESFLYFREEDYNDRVSGVEYLKKGDVVVYKSEDEEGRLIINGCEIPYRKEFILNIKQDLRPRMKFIGTALRHRLNDQSWRKHFNNLFYLPTVQKFIETKCLCNTAETRYNTIAFAEAWQFNVLEVYDLSKIKSINQKYFADMAEVFNSKRNRNTLEAIKLNVSLDKNGEVIKDGDYDITENSNLIKLADRVYEVYNGHEYSEMLLDYNMVQLLLNSGLLKLTDLTLNKCGKDEHIVDKVIALVNSNDKYLYVGSTNLRDTSYIALIDNATKMSSSKVVYHSPFQFEELIAFLYKFGRSRKAEIPDDRVYVSDDNIDVDNFFFIEGCKGVHICRREETSMSGDKIELAIEKKTGYAFIINDRLDMDFKVIFRLKRVYDGLKFIILLDGQDINSSNFRYYVYRVVREMYFEYSKNKEIDHRLYKNGPYIVRKAIIYGRGNSYPFAMASDWLFSACAKQPKGIISNHQ